MAKLTQNSLAASNGSTVYWQGAPVIFKGYLSNTTSSIIMRQGQKTLEVVETANLTTTATG